MSGGGVRIKRDSFLQFHKRQFFFTALQISGAALESLLKQGLPGAGVLLPG